jgi:hypothetical protein
VTLLLSTPPAAVSLPAEGLDLLVLRQQCALVLGSASAANSNDSATSSGAIGTLPALQSLHQRLWDTLMHIDARIFADLIDSNDAASSSKKKRKAPSAVAQQHPLPLEVVDVIATVCAKHHLVIAASGKQILLP